MAAEAVVTGVAAVIVSFLLAAVVAAAMVIGSVTFDLCGCLWSLLRLLCLWLRWLL